MSRSRSGGTVPRIALCRFSSGCSPGVAIGGRNTGRLGSVYLERFPSQSLYERYRDGDGYHSRDWSWPDADQLVSAVTGHRVADNTSIQKFTLVSDPV